MDGALIAGTGEEEEQRCLTGTALTATMTSPQQISTEQKMQQHTGFKRCIASNRAQKQQACWKPESNHVIERYSFTACYFWAAHVESLTLGTHLEVLFKVHLKGNMIFNRAANCRTENGILTIVI